MSQQEFQHLVTHSLSGHVNWPASPPVVQLKIGTMKKKKSGSVIAAMEGREEECCFSLAKK